ncbi:MAG: hypothetical protein ACJ8EE_07065, partial [Bradyrhizobium sp.]
GKHTVVTTSTPKSPGFPRAMVLTVSFVLSPATNSFLSPSPADYDLSKPGWADLISASLTSATDARTTRLRRTQQPQPKISTDHVLPAEF